MNVLILILVYFEWRATENQQLLSIYLAHVKMCAKCYRAQNTMNHDIKEIPQSCHA